MDLQQLQQKLNNAVQAMMNQIETERLRPIEKEAYLKMAACYDIKKATAQEIQHCVKNCSRKVEVSHNIVQNELSQLQSRLERCSMSCQDEVKDKMLGKDNSAANMAEAEKLAFNCSSMCVDKHIALLKGIQSKIESDIGSANSRI